MILISRAPNDLTLETYPQAKPSHQPPPQRQQNAQATWFALQIHNKDFPIATYQGVQMADLHTQPEPDEKVPRTTVENVETQKGRRALKYTC